MVLRGGHRKKASEDWSQTTHAKPDTGRGHSQLPEIGVLLPVHRTPWMLAVPLDGNQESSNLGLEKFWLKSAMFFINLVASSI